MTKGKAAMSFSNLREFIRTLESQGELRRISMEVDPRLQITEIADRVMRREGPALLFERVRGSSMPLAINLFGSAQRMALALGCRDLEEIGQRIRGLLDLRMPQGILGKLMTVLPRLKELSSFPPKVVRSAPCQDVVLEGPNADLGRLPVLTCWPQDGGPFITLPMVITKDPETGVRNMGMYRMQVFDGRTTGMHWHRHKVGAMHFAKRAARNERIEVAVALGGPPAAMYAATAPLPENVEEFAFAGFLQRRPLELVKAKSVDLEVPAEAEIVIEGYVDPTESLRGEGPFGDHTGYYSLPDDYPVFHVQTITMRRDPIYPTTIVGIPPKEDYWLGHATERIFLPLLQLMMPEIVDMHMPMEGVFHNLVFVSIRKQYPGHAFKVMHALWGQGQMMFAKVIVVLDQDLNVRDPKEAWWVALNHIDPERDVLFSRGPVDVLDHASRWPTFGSKMGIDATRKWPEEGFQRPWPDRIVMSPEVRAEVDRMWSHLGLGE
jgi:4-hydroxy-3-polyprenylbenzoate decarboxylase